MTDGDRLLSVEEVADFLGVSVRTVRRMTADGALPHYRIGPRAIRYRASDLARWVNTRFVRPIRAVA